MKLLIAFKDKEGNSKNRIFLGPMEMLKIKAVLFYLGVIVLGLMISSEPAAAGGGAAVIHNFQEHKYGWALFGLISLIGNAILSAKAEDEPPAE